MQTKELRGFSVGELESRERELREQLLRLVMKRNARRLDRSSDLDATKRDLARVLTVLGEKRRLAGEKHA
jgi:large subunit ribosomal protein L29